VPPNYQIPPLCKEEICSSGQKGKRSV